MNPTTLLLLVQAAFAGPSQPPEPVPSTATHTSAASEVDRDRPAKNKKGWNGFEVGSKDGRHSLHFGFLGQLRTTVQDSDGANPTGGVGVRLARPVMVATLWEGRAALRFMPEFATGSPSVLDAEVTVKANDALAVEVGQYRPWISRGFRTGLPVLGLPGRGQIVDRFRVDRDVGMTVQGAPLGGKLEYYLGVHNGAGPNSTTLAPSPLLTARVVVAPLGPVPYTQTPYVRDVGPRASDRDDAPTNPMAVALGAGAYTVANREDFALDDGSIIRTDPRRRWGVSGDAVVSRRRLFALAEGFYEHRFASADLAVRAEDAWGVYGQAGVLAWKPFVDVTVRSGVFNDFDQHLVPIEPGINAYLFGQHGKLQLAYRCDVDLENHDAGCAAHVGTVQVQLLF